MDGTLTLEKIDTTRDEALTLCDNMILHLKSGISDDNINILVGITNQISHILDKLIGYSYFIMRIPYFYVLMILNVRNKEKVYGFSNGCVDFFLNKHLSRRKN